MGTDDDLTKWLAREDLSEGIMPWLYAPGRLELPTGLSDLLSPESLYLTSMMYPETEEMKRRARVRGICRRLRQFPPRKKMPHAERESYGRNLENLFLILFHLPIQMSRAGHD